jgi:hypothetical protein
MRAMAKHLPAPAGLHRAAIPITCILLLWDRWLAIAQDGSVTAFPGKNRLGHKWWPMNADVFPSPARTS